jgi:hypothetical protein
MNFTGLLISLIILAVGVFIIYGGYRLGKKEAPYLHRSGIGAIDRPVDGRMVVDLGFSCLVIIVVGIGTILVMAGLVSGYLAIFNL